MDLCGKERETCTRYLKENRLDQQIPVCRDESLNFPLEGFRLRGFFTPTVGGAYTRGDSAPFPSDAPGCVLRIGKKLPNPSFCGMIALIRVSLTIFNMLENSRIDSF